MSGRRGGNGGAVELDAPARMTHVAVRAHDIDASIRFYERYAGLHIVHEREDEGIRVTWLSHRSEHPDFVNQYNLLGDPALPLILPSLHVGMKLLVEDPLRVVGSVPVKGFNGRAMVEWADTAGRTLYSREEAVREGRFESRFAGPPTALAELDTVRVYLWDDAHRTDGMGGVTVPRAAVSGNDDSTVSATGGGTRP